MILNGLYFCELYLPMSESHHSILEEVWLGKPLLTRSSWKGSEVLLEFRFYGLLLKQAGPFSAATLK